MKKLIFTAAVLLLAGAGCPLMPSQPVPAPAPAPQPAPAPAPTGGNPGGGTASLVQLGENFNLKIGGFRDVQGGLRVTLEEIGDSRCKPNVQCIWAGELSPKLLVELPDGDAPSQEVILGTTTRQKADALGYHFALVKATESEATITVTK